MKRFLKKILKKSAPVIENQDELKILEAKALHHRKEKETEKEFKIWQSLFEKDPRHLKAGLSVIQLSRRLKIEGVRDGAISLLEKNFPEEPLVKLEMGRNLVASQEFESAMAYFRAALEGTKNRDVVLIGLFQAGLKAEKAKEIEVLAEEQLSSSNLNLKNIAARVLIQTGKTEYLIPILSDLLLRNKETSSEIFSVTLFRGLVLYLQRLIQMIDSEGNSNPIDLAHRPDILTQPEAHLKDWANSGVRKHLDQVMIQSGKDRIKNKLPSKKILFVSDANWNFLRDLMGHFESLPETEIRTYDFSLMDFGVVNSLNEFLLKTITQEFRHQEFRELLGSEHYLLKLIDWCDVVYVEWNNKPAVWLSWLLPNDKKLVIRQHSAEAFSHFPMLVNWARVDRLINVAGHIQEFGKVNVSPDKFGCEMHTIPNVNDFENYGKYEKPKDSIILMVGYNNKNKNPLFGLELLKYLRDLGLDFEFHLLGHPWDPEHIVEAEREYYQSFQDYLHAHSLQDKIKYLGFTETVGEHMSNSRYILSSSNREGTHESVLQGMAAGCIPLIRKWPILAQFGSANNIYDQRWVHEDLAAVTTFVEKLETEKGHNVEMDKARNFVSKEYGRADALKMLQEAILN